MQLTLEQRNARSILRRQRWSLSTCIHPLLVETLLAQGSSWEHWLDVRALLVHAGIEEEQCRSVEDAMFPGARETFVRVKHKLSAIAGIPRELVDNIAQRVVPSGMWFVHLVPGTRDIMVEANDIMWNGAAVVQELWEVLNFYGWGKCQLVINLLWLPGMFNEMIEYRRLRMFLDEVGYEREVRYVLNPWPEEH